MQLELSPPFKQQWQNKDPFVEAEKLQGEVFRALEARKTLRFTFLEKSYFIKIHRGVGWFEIIENLIRLRLPVLGARNEYNAIERLEALHIDTMIVVGFGEKGLNPARKKSFIITEDLINTVSLEDFCEPWKNQRPDLSLKYALIKQIANISRTMHDNGINHRDYYICHFLLKLPENDFNNDVNQEISSESLKISLIDLHRAQLREKTPLRWRVKDIASLYFSAMDIGLTQRDFFRFIKIYNNCSLRESLTQNKKFWSLVIRQGKKLWLRKQRKGDSI